MAKKQATSGTELQVVEQQVAANVRAAAEAEALLREAYDYHEQVATAKAEVESAQLHATEAQRLALHVGMRLRVIKDLSGEKFVHACARIGLDDRKARDYIAAYSAYGLEPPPALEGVGQSKMIKLAYAMDRMSEEERNELVEHGRLGGEDVHELGYRAIQKYKSKLIQKEKELAALKSDNEKGKKLNADLAAENRKLKAARPSSEKEIVAQINDLLEAQERIKSDLMLMDLSEVSESTLRLFAFACENLRAVGVRALASQTERVPEMAEADIMIPYTEIQQAIMIERAGVAIQDPDHAAKLEHASPLAEKLAEYDTTN